MFAALGIPLREGRFLEQADADKRVCVVDEDFARRYWPMGGALATMCFRAQMRLASSSRLSASSAP